MAIRQLRTSEEEILRKKSKLVKEITPQVITLLEDMAETMYDAPGVGLAAVQVGVLKRVVVIDIGEGLIELINPEIIKEEGLQRTKEGCLSVPGMTGAVDRAEKLTVKALDRNGNEFSFDAEGYLAVAIGHEMDHLDGILFTDKCIAVEYIDDEDE